MVGGILTIYLVAVIFGGMVSSLALTLVVLPVLYILVNSRQTPVQASSPAISPATQG
jgi:Cu/Ag efflux pump CusA